MKNLKYSLAVSCSTCRKEITTSGLARHRCRIKKPRIAWNKGLTKDHPVVAKYAATNAKIIQEKLANGTFVPSKMSKQALAALSARQSLYNSGGKSKWYVVAGQKVQGTWERDIATKFEEFGIKWIKPSTNTFIWKYVDNDRVKSYTPDFYLPAIKTWIEVKGYWWGNDKEKMEKIKIAYPDRKLIIVEKSGYDSIMRGELVW